MPTNSQRSKGRRWILIGAIGLVVVMVALLAAWKFTPLHDIANARSIAHWLDAKAQTPWMPPIVAVIYVAASLVLFPNTVLCLAVIMALGPLLGTAYAFGGSLCAALTGYGLGRRGGEEVAKHRFQAFNRVSRELRKGGFTSVLMLRALPVAPFTVTNVLSGAARVPLLPFVAATLLGISPYILAFAAFGQQARRLISDPTPTQIAVTVAIVTAAAFGLWQVRSLAVARAK